MDAKLFKKGIVGYYGSPLNKFVADNCNQQMSVMNIDLFLRKGNAIKIIESKRRFEDMKKGQRKSLEILAKIVKAITSYNVKVYIVTGNPPYDVVNVEDVFTGKYKTFNQLELIDFLNFEKPF